MARDPRFDILFEPVRIGPVTAPNRFYQVPHASSTGVDMPNTRRGLRAIRAEGGWGVVCTGYCSIHPSSDDAPLRYSRLWDDEDVKNLALMVDAVHEHGALAGVELFYGSSLTSNRATRETPLSPSGLPRLQVGGRGPYPQHTRAMDKDDIRNLRTWQADAAKRAKSAGFDIVYIYAGMSFGPFQFISRRTNRRTDEYGGSLENRVRLLREMIEDTREAVGDTCAVAVRFSVDELMGEPGLQWHDEGRGVFELVGELPDLWDLKTFGMQDSSNARYSEEGYQEPYVAFAKQMTTKPVVGVGRFTSPDTMVSQVRRGVLDLIGAARPSIADPFLPKKIEEGREDDIRECIGCNICYSCYHESVPIRCTQNPTMGEEWRRGWHPERIEGRASGDTVLVVGAGPAGLEAARALGQRGYEVTLAEAGTELGGRICRESRLPGLGTWIRVRDWRRGQLDKLPNVEVYFDSELSPEHVLEFGFPRVVVATGARWTTALSDVRSVPVPATFGGRVLTPDDIMAGAEVVSPVVLFDFDQYYMGGCLSELLAERGVPRHLRHPRRRGIGVVRQHPRSVVRAAAAHRTRSDDRHRLLRLRVRRRIRHPLRPLCRRGPRAGGGDPGRGRRAGAGGRAVPYARRPPAGAERGRYPYSAEDRRLRRAGRGGARHLRRPPSRPGVRRERRSRAPGTYHAGCRGLTGPDAGFTPARAHRGPGASRCGSHPCTAGSGRAPVRPRSSPADRTSAARCNRRPRLPPSPG